MVSTDTIAAISTPPGSGGIGIVRMSGPRARELASAVVGRLPKPRMAQFSGFYGEDRELIDSGLVLYFASPHSFTGEDIVELQGHGGPVVLDLLLQRLLRLGARLARPGEFSERAFLNGKLDLTQAEAIADLIDAATTSAARMASRTLQGVFSKQIHHLVERLIELRLFVESAIDFPEEEIDFLSDEYVSHNLLDIINELKEIEQKANTGRLLREGMTLVIAGRPNAGKSSLLNALAGQDTAIVTEIPGTTRDLLKERIQIDGMPLHVIDTAGIRVSEDPIEQEGIRRAKAEIAAADRILWVFDDQSDPDHLALDRADLPKDVPLTLVRNKIDLSGKSSGLSESELGIEIALSAKGGQGVEQLRQHLKESVGFAGVEEGEFSARRRHLDALRRALDRLEQGATMLQGHGAGELLAEDLRLAQQQLNEITGDFTSDDLLGRIFATFCIGK
ncbi:MAG: tRNA uridine-5-carboxymethylaminomethyl(34) synthesis GTPase MnmE [Chromatiales bacterium]